VRSIFQGGWGVYGVQKKKRWSGGKRIVTTASDQQQLSRRGGNPIRGRRFSAKGGFAGQQGAYSRALSCRDGPPKRTGLRHE